MRQILFYLGLGTLFTHEMDAMTRHEWRVLPLTAWLPDSTGMQLFLFLHIPLFAGVMALVASKKEKIRARTRMGISLFLIVHALAHILFMGSHHYEFTGIGSNLLIFGGGMLGGIYLWLVFRQNRISSGSNNSQK